MRPREAAEVARFQAKKNRSKILKSAIFELHKCYTPQKKAEINQQKSAKQCKWTRLLLDYIPEVTLTSMLQLTLHCTVQSRVMVQKMEGN